MSVVVNLSLATICFLNQCYPALVGKTTPTGHYMLSHRLVVSPGYGGDVLAFKENASDLFAVHRLWTGTPSEHRAERLASAHVDRRQGVTAGCINVAASTYDRLVDCCSDSVLVVE